MVPVSKSTCSSAPPPISGSGRHSGVVTLETKTPGCTSISASSLADQDGHCPRDPLHHRRLSPLRATMRSRTPEAVRAAHASLGSDARRPLPPFPADRCPQLLNQRLLGRPRQPLRGCPGPPPLPGYRCRGGLFQAPGCAPYSLAASDVGSKTMGTEEHAAVGAGGDPTAIETFGRDRY